MKPNALYDSLYREFGPRRWWPFKGKRGAFPKSSAQKFEVVCGAVLTQNTAWRNVEKAIDNLRAERLLSTAALAACPLPKLRKVIRPAGYYNQKAGYLKSIADYLVKHYRGDLNAFFKQSTCSLKHEILEWKGIGPETRDSILLYAGGKSAFVVDAYTQRLAKRYPLPGSAYDELQFYFESSLPREPALYNEFHALIVELAKRYCRKRSPDCGHCPLRAKCAKII